MVEFVSITRILRLNYVFVSWVGLDGHHMQEGTFFVLCVYMEYLGKCILANLGSCIIVRHLIS